MRFATISKDTSITNAFKIFIGDMSYDESDESEDMN